MPRLSAGNALAFLGVGQLGTDSNSTIGAALDEAYADLDAYDGGTDGTSAQYYVPTATGLGYPDANTRVALNAKDRAALDLLVLNMAQRQSETRYRDYVTRRAGIINRWLGARITPL